MARKQASSSLLFHSTIPPSSSPQETASSSSTPLSSSSSPESSNDSGPEVGSILAYEPYILEPFMGLHSVDHPDDPWHHKAYNLYQPLYTGGGTFEQYMKSGHYKRDLQYSPSSQLPTFASYQNVLTPDMLDRLLHIKSNFKSHYPTIYKSMMDQLTKGKNTISIKPPEVPQSVSHRNLELSAAEINPLESLEHSYQEDLKKIAEAQNEKQQQAHDITSNTPEKETHTLTTMPETLPIATHQEEPSLGEDPQNALKKVPDNQIFFRSIKELSLNEQQGNWENSQESLKTLRESKLVFENSPENINEHPIPLDKSQDIIDEHQSIWENPKENLNALSEQLLLFSEPQDRTPKEEKYLWQTPEELQHDVQNFPQNIQTSVNDKQSLWMPSALRKRDSFWAEIEALEEQQEHKQDDLEPIFDFDEDFE